MTQATIRFQTAQRVELELAVAGLGPRAIAWGIDAGVLFAFWALVVFSLSLLGYTFSEVWQALSSAVRILVTVSLFATVYLYWVVSEVVTQGRSIGKRLAGVRVISLDGAPLSPGQAAIRNLVRVIDFLPLAYTVGAIVMLADSRHRRLGDIVAGTVAVLETPVTHAPRSFEAPQGPFPAPPRLEPLAPGDAELVLRFLERLPSLEPASMERVGRKLLTRVLPTVEEAERARLAADPAALATTLRAQLGPSPHG